MNPRPRPQANLGLASSPEEPFGCILQKTLAFRGFLHYLLLPRCLAGGEGLSFLQQDIGVGGVLNSAWDDELVRGGYSMNVAPAMRSEVQVKLQWAYSKTVRESQP